MQISDGQFDKFDTVFMGRKSFELMVKMNEMPIRNKETYIFSNTLESTEYGTVIKSEVCVVKVLELKRKTGNDIWFFGGADLLSEFLNNKLIDEIQLAVHPILLGKGKRLFQEKLEERIKCTFLSTKSYESGLVMLKYKIDN